MPDLENQNCGLKSSDGRPILSTHPTLENFLSLSKKVAQVLYILQFSVLEFPTNQLSN